MTRADILVRAVVVTLAALALALGAPLAAIGWVGDPARLPSPARELALREAVKRPAADPARRIAELTDALRGAPLSPGAWLDLAIARRAAGESGASVTKALAMSAATGPNEALLMAGRASFAAPFLSALPPPLRGRLALDLAGGIDGIDGPGRERLREVFQREPAAVGLRAALVALSAGAVADTLALPRPAP